MNLIIDIQGVYGETCAFIPKEIAVASVERECYGHWVVSPPYGYGKLKTSIQKQNLWLRRYYHGIAWSEGDTPLHVAENILRNIIKEAYRVFVRGAAKGSYLTHLTGCFIINLEEGGEDELGYLPFHKLPRSETRCVYHGLNNKKQPYICAVDNVTKIRSWLRHEERLDSLWEYRTTTSLHFDRSPLKPKEEEEKEEGDRSVKDEKEEQNQRLRTSTDITDAAATAAATDVTCYEQSPNSDSSPEYKESYSRSIPCGPYP